MTNVSKIVVSVGSTILRSAGSGKNLLLVSVIESMVFPKPLVTIPPLPAEQQRASTHAAISFMSFGTIQVGSCLLADWPDV